MISAAAPIPDVGHEGRVPQRPFFGQWSGDQLGGEFEHVLVTDRPTPVMDREVLADVEVRIVNPQRPS